MQFDDADQPMVWRDRALCDGMTHPQIVDGLVAEATANEYEPMDLNWAGIPNVYLRGRYGRDKDKPQDPPVWVADGFVMFVKRVGQ